MKKERLDEIAADYYGHDSAGNVTFNHEGFLTHVDAERGKEAVAFQYRMRPDWDEYWGRWTDCNRDNCEDYRRTPINAGWHYEVRYLFLFPTPTIPEGMVLVPIEPTQAMTDAAHAAEHCGNAEPHFALAYKAMLAAAQGERK